MSLKDKLEREKNQSLLKAIENLEENIKSEIREIKYQNKLLRDRMIEIEQSQESRNQKIDNLIERLEKVTNKNEVESFEEFEIVRNYEDFFELMKEHNSNNEFFKNLKK